jgi:hypothetical protein
MELLPAGPLHIIALHLSKSDDKYHRLCDVSEDAANLMLVGNVAFTELSIAVQEKLEPGVRLVNDSVFERMRIHEGLSEASKADVLKKACRDRGLMVSGVKAALWRRLMEAEVVARPPRVCILSAKFRSEMRAMRSARMCVSTVKLEYRLTEKDLTTLSCERKRNPMYRSAAPMRLYLIRDVARVALKKHASSSHTRIRVPAISADERRTSRETLLSKKLGDITLDSRIFSVSESACRARDLYLNSGRGGGAVKVAADIIATNTRLHILERALEDRGCELRSDSRLCTGFVENDDGDPEDIAVSMLEMKFFHNHTEYASILDDLWEDARRERDGEYDSDIDEYEYDNYHHIDPHELSSSAKSEAMKQWADTHDLDDVLDIPESLRPSVFHLKAECIVSDTRKAWRARQPRIPVQVLNNIETVFYQIHKRTRDAESLASLRSTLEDAESGLSARVDAVSVMWDKIREWPHAIPGATVIFDTEFKILNATHATYIASAEKFRIEKEEKARLKKEREDKCRIEKEEKARLNKEREDKFQERKRIQKMHKARLKKEKVDKCLIDGEEKSSIEKDSCVCPVCKKTCKSRDGVSMHMIDKHQLYY